MTILFGLVYWLYKFTEVTLLGSEVTVMILIFFLSFMYDLYKIFVLINTIKMTEKMNDKIKELT